MSIDKTHFYTYGDKLKVGDVILYNSYKNLLKGLYSLNGQLKYNGVYIYDIDGRITVAKEMVFSWTVSPTWLLDNNEPKVILSPSRLRMPNSSYKILGYIPDISGHGNHGVIHNSAYAGASGANGYLQNFSGWTKASGVSSTDSVISSSNNLVAANGWIAYVTSGTVIPTFKVEISGIPINGNLRFEGSDQTLVNGVNTIQGLTTTKVSGFYISNGYDNDWSNLRIEQIGEYEGAYCFDGVDDFVTIPTLPSGGKQVLMKVNSFKTNNVIYDQRSNNNRDSTFCIVGDTFIAYKTGNSGNTYIDGISNQNIVGNSLINIAHNITITNKYVTTSNSGIPNIGAQMAQEVFGKIALYDFMLFDNISTDDKIKELNEYVGTEGNIFEFNPPMFTIDLPMAIKNIKVYQGGSEISPGYLYLNKDTEFEVYISLNDGKYAVDTITVDGVEIAKDRVVGEYNIFKFTLNGSSEQKITIHSYEYIMYEDIPQPYPALLTFHDGNFNNYTYGDKVKLNSIIKVRAGFNLFPDLYTINSYYLNGEKLSFNALAAKDIVVTNDITLTAEKVYKLEGSAPKCIFSPSKLRIPNSSYKYLGYIPDISGNGNNGTFYNFAYEGMSGANGYSIIFGDNKTYQYLRHSTDFNPTTINFAIKSINAYTTVSLLYSYIKQSGGLTSYNKYIPSYKIRVSGIKEGFTLKYTYIKNQTDTSVSVFDIVSDGVHIIPPSYQSEGNLTNNDVWIGFTLMGTFSDLYNITVEVLPDYEGSICFDGVDDYIKIDTTGGMTMLMKANVMSTTDRILYDQRDKNSEGNMYKEFAVLTNSSDSILAYAGRNPNGKTYIDGVLNTNITCGQLLNITHNITALPNSNLVGTEQGVRIGASVMPASYCKAAVFDFMLFDTKCTDDVIKQLNDIIGIEGDYVQKPSYYWDAYGKSNFDGDKETIPQLGTAESYSFASFDNELDWYLSSNNYIDVVSRNGYKITLKNLSTGIDGWRFQNSTVKRFISNDIPFKIKSDKTVRVYWDMHYNAISSTELRQKVVSVTTINPNEDTLINLRHLTEEELTELNVNKSTMYYLLWFDVSTLAVNEEVTIEMLPAEGGRDLWLNNYGVAYDKMSGYGGYSFKSFNDSADSWNIRGDGTGVEIISRDGYSMTIKKLVQNLDWHISNNEYRYPTVLSKELPFRCKSNKNVGLIWKLKYKTEGATSDTTVTLLNQQLTPNVPLEVNLPYKTQEELTELGAVSTSVYYLLYFSNTTLAIGEEYTVEMLPLYPNGLVLDGVDDYLENLDIPALSDFTVITKRTNLLEEYGNNVSYLVKGIAPTGSRDWALLMEYWYDKLCMNFIYDNSVGNYITPFDSIGFVTPTSYNGLPMTKGISNDTAGLRIARRVASYWNGVFYKLMLYPRTTNMLTINMIKNMMAEDGIIDVQGKLFTDKYTGDFYNLDFNKDFLIGN